MPDLLKVAVAGYPCIGRIYTSGWGQAERLFGTPAIGRNRERTQELADAFGIPIVLTIWRDVAADPDIDVIDVCTGR